MIAHEYKNLKYYQFESFCELGIRHGFFTRLGGVSPAPFDSLNTSTTGGDSRENVTENVARMFEALGLDIRTRYDGWQRHTKNVLFVDAPRDMSCPPLEADGLVTSNPNVTLLERFGDCVPVMLYDPVVKAVAICHAGWPGTLDNICAITLDKMKKNCGSDPKNVVAGIGPSIGPDHFEVKEDVASRFRTVFGKRYEEICDLSDGRIRLDLWKANRMRLEAEGVKKIETAGICTVCRKDEWFSHRGDHGKSGRFGALITLG